MRPPNDSFSNALRSSHAVLAPALVATFLLFCAGSRSQESKQVDPVVAKAQEQMERFVEEFGTLRCDEHILQQKLKGNDKVQYHQETVYDSLVMIRFQEGAIRVFEQHTEEKMPRRPVFKPLVTTHGFSTLAIIFHPYYAESFRFSRIGNDVMNNETLVRIHFEHIPGTPSPTIYQKFVNDQPIDFSGTAWIDPATGAIHRIEGDTGPTLKDMGLKDLRAQLTYGEVTLDDETQPRWLPISATVDLETPRQHWRNVHSFTDYRKYRVAARVEGGTQQ